MTIQDKHGSNSIINRDFFSVNICFNILNTNGDAFMTFSLHQGFLRKKPILNSLHLVTLDLCNVHKNCHKMPKLKFWIMPLNRHKTEFKVTSVLKMYKNVKFLGFLELPKTANLALEKCKKVYISTFLRQRPLYYRYIRKPTRGRSITKYVDKMRWVQKLAKLCPRSHWM